MISMELHLMFQTALTATFLIVAIIFLYQMLSQKMTKSSKIKSPPQAKGAWPIIGHLHLLGGPELPHIVLGRMADECGPIFTIKLGVYQILVVSDHMIAKECFTKNDKVFASRPKILAAELMAYNYAGFGVSPYGDYWKHMRKMVIAELLSHRNVEMLRYIRVQEVGASMKDIFETWVTNKKSAYADMARVEMKELFGNLILNIIGRTISGKRFPPNDDEAVRVHRVVRKFFELCGTFVVSDYIPYVKCLDLGGREKAMKLSAKDLDNILEEWLDEHKKRRETGLKGESKPDFMDVLISILEASLLQGFELMKPSTEPIDMTASVGLTNMKKTPLEVLLSPRLPIHMYHAADAPNDLVSI
ncbi:cytochrome P450 82A2 [Artemisia annua]|uniref:Cytochrome P450 82A2 n=1 Tax=Artemisia annua TaxID=35608 RepID=A0A2U1M9G3_ARTAN|nr:cytochrome P450 82A2 [Artemisia annua]